MIPEVTTGDYMRMFCLNCARKTVSPKTNKKNDALTSYLRFRAAFTNRVKLSFARIDGIIGENLPISAYRNEAWWNSTHSNVHTKAWLDAGWQIEEVNLKEGYVVFKKVKTIPRKRKTLKKEKKKPFTPVRVRIPKSNKPSKTKISKLYARLKNIERHKTQMPLYRGSLKPRPKHEKKLFKSEKKPQ